MNTSVGTSNTANEVIPFLSFFRYKRTVTRKEKRKKRIRDEFRSRAPSSKEGKIGETLQRFITLPFFFFELSVRRDIYFDV